MEVFIPAESSKNGFKGVGSCLAKNGERWKKQVYIAFGICFGNILLRAVTELHT